MSAKNAASPFPDYENPPVVETIVGVQFEQLAGFGNAHLGEFWGTLDKDEWPTVADAPLLPPQFERFTEEAKWAMGLQLKLTQDQSSRLQITNKDGDRMLQVQNGRLHFNWLGAGGGPYLRYEQVRDGFLRLLQQFVEFLDGANCGGFRPNQWEVTYLNHIPKGTVWSTPGDWTFFQPLSDIPDVEGLVRPESFSGKWHFVIPEQRGRLHVHWQHAHKSSPQDEELVVLTLTARGPLGPSNQREEIAGGLDLGHETIVRSFSSFMSNDANDYWGLRNG